MPATTVFPSTTGVAYLPFLTGCFPGTCDVPGIRWLDSTRYGGGWVRDRTHVRNYCGVQGGKLNTDIPQRVLSLFDAEKDSVALCSPFTRGLPQARQLTNLSRAVVGGSSHYTRGYKRLDRIVGHDLARIAGRNHRFTFAVFPGVDGLAHSYDPRHPKVLDVYRQFDKIVGQYAAAGGMDGDHLLVIASDHGMTRIERHTDLAVVLEERGLRALRHPILWRREPHVGVMVSGNASAQIYLKPGITRTHRWSIPSIESGDVPGIPKDLVEGLVALDGVALVAGVDGADVIIVSREGRARLIDLGDGRITYEPESADVLELGGSFASKYEREWFAESISGRFPDSPTQLLQLFRSSRAGDIVISATEEADLRQDWEVPEHRCGHGGLTHEHMRCVIAMNRPAEGPMRSVDVFPLIMKHLGHEPPTSIDGVYGGELS